MLTVRIQYATYAWQSGLTAMFPQIVRKVMRWLHYCYSSACLQVYSIPYHSFCQRCPDQRTTQPSQSTFFFFFFFGWDSY